MARRKKMGLSDLLALGISYHAYSRVKTPDGVYGYRYRLDKPPTDEQTAAILSWKNTRTGTAHHRFAPEITYSTVTIFDHCIREG